jgi:hypothetical protein
MLNQVAKVYTPKAFELFQNEVEEVSPLSIIDHNASQATHTPMMLEFSIDMKNTKSCGIY